MVQYKRITLACLKSIHWSCIAFCYKPAHYITWKRYLEDIIHKELSHLVYWHRGVYGTGKVAFTNQIRKGSNVIKIWISDQHSIYILTHSTKRESLQWPVKADILCPSDELQDDCSKCFRMRWRINDSDGQISYTSYFQNPTHAVMRSLNEFRWYALTPTMAVAFLLRNPHPNRSQEEC